MVRRYKKDFHSAPKKIFERGGAKCLRFYARGKLFALSNPSCPSCRGYIKVARHKEKRTNNFVERDMVRPLISAVTAFFDIGWQEHDISRRTKAVLFADVSVTSRRAYVTKLSLGICGCRRNWRCALCLQEEYILLGNALRCSCFLSAARTIVRTS